MAYEVEVAVEVIDVFNQSSLCSLCSLYDSMSLGSSLPMHARFVVRACAAAATMALFLRRRRCVRCCLRRYDAFYTTMEILRVRLSHPLAHPKEYSSLDVRFRKFMGCELGEAPRGNKPLCTQRTPIRHYIPHRLAPSDTVPLASPAGLYAKASRAWQHARGSMSKIAD